MDVNNSKLVKESVFLCPEDDMVEQLARSPKSGCSCSPPNSPSVEVAAEAPIIVDTSPVNTLAGPNSFSGVLLAKS